MSFSRILFLSICLCLSSCTPYKKSRNSSSHDSEQVMVIGHRGYAGKLPENSLQGFSRAISRGVHAVELDVVVSKDKKVVVSHEPYMASDYMATPDGHAIAHEDERKYNLYKMSYRDIKKFPLGLRRSKRFPVQRRVKSYKPLLSEVFENVEHQIHIRELDPVIYFVELKSHPKEYGKFQPLPAEFVELVAAVATESNLLERIVFQSFDPEILNELHKKYPQVQTSFLVKNGKMEENLKLLNFTPQYYAPYYKMVTNEQYVNAVHDHKMKIITWTVNSTKNAKRLMDLGVDGIISDFPLKILRKL